MPARLILNADDFGLTRGINRSIAELHSAGALTSATLMANGPAFEGAVRIAHAQPTLGIGCHVVLTDGVPVSPPETIPTLMGPDGRSFRRSLTDFFAAVMFGRVSEEDVAREALAQINRIQQQGIALTHVDTHKHTHILPRVARPLLAVAEAAGIRAIRNPFEPHWSSRIGNSPFLRRVQLRALGQLQSLFVSLPQIRSGRIRTTNGTVGISATGSLDATTLRAILDILPAGTWELVCHPGYNDRDLDAVTTRLRASRDIERAALLEAFSPIAAHQSHPPHQQLINYKDVAQFAPASR